MTTHNEDREGFVRAAVVRRNIELLRATHGHLRAEVLGRLSRSETTALSSAPRTGWVPIEVDVALAEATLVCLGPEETSELARSAVHDQLTGSLLGPIVAGARRLFEPTPHGLLRVLPYGWKQIYRGIGTPRTRRINACSAEVIVQDPLVRIVRSEGYRLAWLGMFKGLADVGVGSRVDRSNIFFESGSTGQGGFLRVSLTWPVGPQLGSDSR